MADRGKNALCDRVRRYRRTFLLYVLHREDEVEDPEVLLSQAQREMQEMYARNRERAVQAITQKNNLQQMVDSVQGRIAEIERKAQQARQSSDLELAARYLSEKRQFEAVLEETRASLAQAVTIVDVVNDAINREEERIRRKTGQILALKAQWKVRQLQADVNNKLAALGKPDASRPLQDLLNAHARNRELMMQKNNLQQMIDDTQRRIDNLREKAERAARRGDADLARTLRSETTQQEATLAVFNDVLPRVVDLTEAARTFIDHEAELIRQAEKLDDKPL